MVNLLDGPYEVIHRV